MTDARPIHWRSLADELLATHADCQLAQRDEHRFSLTSRKAEGRIQLELWVHSTGQRRVPAPGEDLSQLPAGEWLHVWGNVFNAQGGWERQLPLCDRAELLAMLHDWRAPWASTPAGLVLPSQADGATPNRKARIKSPATPPATSPDPQPIASTALQVLAQPADLAPLDAADRPAAELALQADLARLDLQQLARHWPRDARGRLAAKTTALLAAYGPPLTVNQRQPCLMITSGGVRDMPSWRVSVSAEFRENPPAMGRRALAVGA